MSNIIDKFLADIGPIQKEFIELDDRFKENWKMIETLKRNKLIHVFIGETDMGTCCAANVLSAYVDYLMAKGERILRERGQLADKINALTRKMYADYHRARPSSEADVRAD